MDAVELRRQERLRAAKIVRDFVRQHAVDTDLDRLRILSEEMAQMVLGMDLFTKDERIASIPDDLREFHLDWVRRHPDGI